MTGITHHVECLFEEFTSSSCRIVVVDHKTDDVYVTALHAADDSGAQAIAEAWIADTSIAITALQKAACEQQSYGSISEGRNGEPKTSQPAANDHSVGDGAAHLRNARELEASLAHTQTGGNTSSSKSPLFKLRRGREQYMQDVESCLQVRIPHPLQRECSVLYTHQKLSSSACPQSVCIVRGVIVKWWTMWCSLPHYYCS